MIVTRAPSVESKPNYCHSYEESIQTIFSCYWRHSNDENEKKRIFSNAYVVFLFIGFRLFYFYMRKNLLIICYLSDKTKWKIYFDWKEQWSNEKKNEWGTSKKVFKFEGLIVYKKLCKITRPFGSVSVWCDSKRFDCAISVSKARNCVSIRRS